MARRPGGDGSTSVQVSTDKPVGAAASGRVFTVPNIISFVRLLGVPLFLYLLLVADRPALALVVLAVGAGSDWVDGYIARATGQVSRLGQVLDPAADRLYIMATVLAFTVRGIVPWQFTALLLGREVVVGIGLMVLRYYRYGPLQVHYLGKTATFVLLFAFPFLLLAGLGGAAELVGLPVGWALAIWGLTLYWAAAVVYVVQIAQLVRDARRDAGPAGT